LEDVFVSSANIAPFMRFVESGVDHKFTTLKQVVEMVFHIQSDSADEIKSNFISAHLSSSVQRDLVRKRFAGLCEVTSIETIVRSLYRMIDIDVNLRVSLLMNPETLLCPIVVNSNPVVRSLAEHLVYELFPTLVAPRANQSAEALLNDVSDDLIVPIPDLSKEIQVDPVDADSFTQLAIDFATFCTEIASHLDIYVGNNPDSQRILAPLFRIMRWFCLRSNELSHIINDQIWQLFIILGKSEWRGGCNLCESFRCIVTLPREIRTRLLSQNIADLVIVLFPLDFETHVRLNATIFIDILMYAATYLPGMRDNDSFKETFRNFWMIPICDEQQVWIVSKLADLGSSSQIASVILSLLYLVEEDCLPVTVLPFILEGVIPRNVILPFFKTAMALCEMAFVESAVLELILEICAGLMFEKLRGLIGNEREAIDVCKSALPSLCALFLSPIAKTYRKQLSEFLSDIIQRDVTIGSEVLVNLPALQELIGDPELAWASLSLRLNCALRASKTHDVIARCINDAIEMVPSSGQLYGAAFVDQLVGALGDEVLTEHTESVRTLLSGFKAIKIYRPEGGLEWLPECGMEA
jgi:hypothetical protein